MKSIEELQADLKQIYAELEERKLMEQEATAKTVNFHEISSKAERYKMEGHPMSGRDEHEQAMYLLLLLSVAVMDDTVYETSFSLLYRISHGMGFKGDVQELFVQAAQINFERIDEITRLFIKDDVRLVMMMECMMLAQSFKKEYKKAMEYIAELCILMKLEKEQITMISNIARAILMQDAAEYRCDVKNTYEVFDCYIKMFLDNKQINIWFDVEENLKERYFSFSEVKEEEDHFSFIYNMNPYEPGTRSWYNERSGYPEMFRISKNTTVLYKRYQITPNEIRKGAVVVAIGTNAPALAYSFAMKRYKEAGGIIE